MGEVLARFRPNLSQGIRLMLVATVFFALLNACVKAVAHLPTVEIVFFRAAISLLLTAFSLWRHKVQPVLGHNRKYLVSRGIFGVVSLLTFFYAIQHLSLATAVTLQYLSPIITAILAIYILDERMHPWQWAFFGLSFLGVWVMQGPGTVAQPFDLAVALASPVFSALAYNSVRKLKDSEHPLVIVFYFPLIAVPITGLFSLWVWQTPQGLDWLWLGLMGLFTQIAQESLTKAIQAEELSRITYVNYLGVLFAIGLGMLFFDEYLDSSTGLGIALVLAGVLANLIFGRKIRTLPPEEQPIPEE